MNYEFMELTKETATVGKRYNVEGEYRYVADGDTDMFFGWFGNSPICQYATCTECKTKIMSWSKNAICPKCNKDCYLT